MKINIHNCSSPGASFTTNTENVMLSCYNWIQKNINENKDFNEFRKEVSKMQNFNENNARNIYPLLLKAGFIVYAPKTKLKYDSFFTELGEAYVKSIQLERNIKNDRSSSESVKNEALIRANTIKKEILFEGLTNIFKAESNYKDEIYKMLNYLYNYQKIDKYEFAYMLFALQSNRPMDDNVILSYRNKELKIDVEVNVRNDIELRNKSGNDRNEGIAFLTSYSYFISLFEQSGLVLKNGQYYEIDKNSIKKIVKLLKEVK